MPRIFLHLGAQKTGSKTLQKSLYESRAELAKNGIEYIGPPSFHEGLFSAFSPAPETWAVNIKRGLTPDQIAQERASTLAQIEHEITSSKCQSIILSAENLFRLPDKNMAAMRDFFSRLGDVHAVYYYRHLTAWRASYSQQLARGGTGRDIASFSESLVPIATAPPRIIRVFGADQSHIVSFESAIKEGLCKNFLSICSAPEIKPPEIEEIISNSGMSKYAAWALFAYNGYIKSSGKSRDLRVYRKLHSIPGPKLTIPTLNSVEHAEYTRHYNELTAELGLKLEHPDDILVSDDPIPMMIPAEALVDLFADYQTASARAAIASELAKKKAQRPVKAQASPIHDKVVPETSPAKRDAKQSTKQLVSSGSKEPPAETKPAAAKKPSTSRKTSAAKTRAQHGADSSRSARFTETVICPARRRQPLGLDQH